MTTQELKSYIDRILGNNIRLLLPSYWWKRAFGAVIDKVDEKVEKSELKTINGEPIVGNGDLKIGVKSVESVEALEKLDAEVGDIATITREIGPQTIKAADCYFANSVENYANEWDKYTVIKKIEETEENVVSTNALYLCASKESLTKDTICVGYESGFRVYSRFIDNVQSLISLEIVNNLLASGNYRLTIISSPSTQGIFDKYFTFYTEVAKGMSDVYIKSETWTRLLKEGDVKESEEGKNSIEIRELYIGDSPTQEQRDWNLETKQLVEENKCTTIYKLTETLDVLPAGTIIPQSLYQEGLFFYIVTTSANSNVVVNVGIDKDGNSSIASYVGTADSQLSTTSTNAIQNKVVTAALNAKADKTYVDEKVANADGANLKTINGVSLRGEGNIELHMSEIHKKLQDLRIAVLNNEEVLAAAINDINRRLLELENSSNQ